MPSTPLDVSSRAGVLAHISMPEITPEGNIGGDAPRSGAGQINNAQSYCKVSVPHLG
jgi:hypothetical protein